MVDSEAHIRAAMTMHTTTIIKELTARDGRSVKNWRLW
jgi:hypothetical protein